VVHLLRDLTRNHLSVISAGPGCRNSRIRSQTGTAHPVDAACYVVPAQNVPEQKRRRGNASD
jgi:hypothetical protein